MNDHYEIVVYYCEQDNIWLAEVPELPNIITDGSTRHDALKNAEQMITDYLSAAHAQNWPIPKPKGRLAFA